MPPCFDEALVSRVAGRRRGDVTASDESQPLLFWKTLGHKSADLQGSAGDAKRVQYMAVRRSEHAEETSDTDGTTAFKEKMPPLSHAAGPPLCRWSCPMRIKLGEDARGCRQNVTALGPRSDGSSRVDSHSYDVSTVCVNHVTYMMLSTEAHAQLELHNNTAFALHFGQSYSDAMQPGTRQLYCLVQLSRHCLHVRTRTDGTSSKRFEIFAYLLRK